MAILKKGVYNSNDVCSVSIDLIDFSESSNDEASMVLAKEDYETLLSEYKEKGYNEGKEMGYEKGFEEGLLAAKEEKDKVFAEIELAKESLHQFMDEKSLEYINLFKTDIGAVIFKSIEKLFFGVVSDEMILKEYAKQLLATIDLRYADYRVCVNQHTFDALFESGIVSNADIDNSMDDFDFKVFSKSETVEYFKKDEFEKISKLFE